MHIGSTICGQKSLGRRAGHTGTFLFPPSIIAAKGLWRKGHWWDNSQKIKSSTGNRNYLKVESWNKNSEELEIWYNLNRCTCSQTTCKYCYKIHWEVLQAVQLRMPWKTEVIFYSHRLRTKILHIILFEHSCFCNFTIYLNFFHKDFFKIQKLLFHPFLIDFLVYLIKLKKPQNLKPNIFIASVFTVLNSRGLMPLKPLEYSASLIWWGRYL